MLLKLVHLIEWYLLEQLDLLLVKLVNSINVKIVNICGKSFMKGLRQNTVVLFYGHLFIEETLSVHLNRN